jgi:hypothetical protein
MDDKILLRQENIHKYFSNSDNNFKVINYQSLKFCINK